MARKLTWKDVDAIRRSERPPKELAERFQVSRSQIYRIRDLTCWVKKNETEQNPY